MSSTTRHFLRKKDREALANSTELRNEDTFQENSLQEDSFEPDGRNRFESSHAPRSNRPVLVRQDRPVPRNINRAGSIAGALEDSKSELSQFIDEDSDPLRSNKAWFYSLALEPLEVRRERIIMLSEAYAIFGALFLNGTWFIWEYGTSTGGTGISAFDRAFNTAAAVAIVSNVFMTMFSSFLWIMSICYSGSHSNWVYGARNYLNVLFHLLVMILFSTVITVGMGVYANLKEHLPETVLVLLFIVVVVGCGMYHTGMLCAGEIPLEYRHFPLWFKLGVLPFPLLTNRGRGMIREGSRARARALKEQAAQERTVIGLVTKKNRMKHSDGSVERLLNSAAFNAGREDVDVTPFAVRLSHDWYNEAQLLKGMEVDTLAKYMPRHLAEKVKEILDGTDFC